MSWSASCVAHFASPVGEAQSAERMVRGAGRDWVRLAASGHDRVEGPLPTVADADVEPGGVEAHIAAQDARELDVAHLVVDDVGPRNPRLLHGDGLQAEVGCHTCDLAGVVRLHAADGNERVAALCQCLGDEVLELAGLVAAEGDSRVAILALGPDLDLAAQWALSRGSGWMGDGPNVSGWRGKSSRVIRRS